MISYIDMTSPTFRFYVLGKFTILNSFALFFSSFLLRVDSMYLPNTNLSILAGLSRDISLLNATFPSCLTQRQVFTQ